MLMSSSINLEILTKLIKKEWEILWNVLSERISMLTVFCTMLAFVIPYSIYKLNRLVHRKNNPPWKYDEN